MESSGGKGRLTPHRQDSSFDGSKTLDTLSESNIAASWALQKQLSKKLAVFYQGFYNGANGNYFPADIVSGLGGYWSATQRLGLFASYNWSLDKMGSPSGGYSGFAYAY